VRAYRSALEHFIAWAAPDNGRLEVTESAVRRFVNEHLADCKCAGRVQRGEVTARSALNHLLTILAGIGRWAPEVKVSAHIDTELRRFCAYASDVCGLAPMTLVSRRQWIGRFLADQFPKGGIDFSRLRPKHIRDFFRTKPRTSTVFGLAVDSQLRMISPQGQEVLWGDRPIMCSSLDIGMATQATRQLLGPIKASRTAHNRELRIIPVMYTCT
jgi:hypothetical protein